MIFRSVLVAAATAAVGFIAPASAADNGAAWFKGKNLTYIVATNPGGGYDTYARLITKYMIKHLPVSKIIVKNVPGAGHIIGANYIYASKPNGLTIGTFNTGLIYAQLVKRKGVLFDLSKMTWIGKASEDPRVFLVSKKSGLKTFADLKRKKPVLVAVSGVGSAAYNETSLLEHGFGLNLKIVTGYRGNQAEMAMLRGEIEGELGSKSSLEPFVRNGNGHFLLQIGGSGPVPQASTFANTEDTRSIVALIESQSRLGRLTAGPPGIPKARADALIAAYRSALTDPGLLADAKKLGLPIVPEYGDTVRKLVVAALKQPPSVVARVKDLMDIKSPLATVTGKLLSVGKKGKRISFLGKDGKKVKAKVSGSRTKIFIAGKKAKRKALKLGMNCTISYALDTKEPKKMECQ